jgi:hypothetical protein
MGMGAVDGTREWAICSSSEDGVATSDCNRYANSNFCIHILDANGSRDGEIVFDSFVTDGVEVDITNSFNDNYYVTAVLFGGDTDLTVYADFLSAPPDSGGFTDYSDPGFQPDLILFGSTGTSSTSSDARISVGAAIRSPSLVNRASAMMATDSAGTSETASYIASARCVVNLESSALSRSYSVEEFQANGFRLRHHTGASSGNIPVGYLALKMNDVSTYLGTMDAPSSTGDDAQTGPGFTPQFVMLGEVDDGAVDTVYENGAFAIGVFDEDGDEATQGQSDEDAQGTTDTQCMAHSRAAYFADEAGTIIHDAQFSTMDANGWTLNFSTATRAAKWWALAIETEAAGALSVDQSDSITVIDAVTPSLLDKLYKIDVADTVTVVDAATAAVTPLLLDVSDAITVVDATTPSLLDTLYKIDVSESITVTDAETAALTPLLIDVSDAISVAEAVTPTITTVRYTIDVADAITVVDAATVDIAAVADLAISVSDSISVADTTTAALTPLLISQVDTITVTDASTTALTPLLVDVSESITVVDAVTATLGITALNIDVADAITVTDAATAAVTPLLIDVADSVTLVESVTAAISTIRYTIDVSEAISVADTISQYLDPLVVSVSEAITVLDFTSTSVGLLDIVVFESISVSDAATISIRLPTPAYRTAAVAAENRTAAVAAENRTAAVAREDRTAVVRRQ